MSDVQEYLAPDYYPDFHCKMGACRHACCEGWPISVTMNDYFRLLGVDCSPALRRRLDGSLHLAEHPTPEAYAQISPRYDGSCPLHLPDGRCALHAELGDGILAAVCRLYPRGVRNGADREVSCANSCEAVLELFLHRTEPLTFRPLRSDFGLPDAPPRLHDFHTAGREQAIRLWLIRQVQDRRYPLAQRMMLLGSALHAMDLALTARDEARVDRLLTGSEAVPVPELPHFDRSHVLAGLHTVERFLAITNEHSHSIHNYGEAALRFFRGSADPFAQYTAAAARFAALAPQWETWLEHMLVNHLYFVQFPFQDRPIPLADEYLAVCAVYVLLRCLLVGWMATHEGDAELVDVAAAAFRLIDHTSFDRYAAPLMKDLGCDIGDRLWELLAL